jgi:hypothetical protein
MRFLRAVVVALVVLVAFVWGFAKITDNDITTAAPRLGKGLTGLRLTTAAKVRLSPDGSRLAVVEAGSVVVLGLNSATVETRVGSNVVDATWMSDSKRVLFTEGPIPTGQVTVIDLTGAVNGVATLKPSIGFGDGAGIAVDQRGTRAAVISVTRDAIGGREHRDLAVIELQTGAVRVYPTPTRDESSPLFVDEDLIAVASEGDSGPARLDLVEVATGAVHPGRPISDGPYVRTISSEVVVARRASQGATRLLAVDSETGDERELHVTKPHRKVVAVDIQLTRAIVRVPDPGGESHLAIEPFA